MWDRAGSPQSEVGDGAVVVALVAEGVTSIAESHGQFGIEPDRLIVVGDGAVVVALFVIGGTSIVERHGQFGIEPDRLIQVGHGAVAVALGAVSGRAIVVEGRQIASFPFPRLDALRAGNDRRLGVLRGYRTGCRRRLNNSGISWRQKARSKICNPCGACNLPERTLVSRDMYRYLSFRFTAKTLLLAQND